MMEGKRESEEREGGKGRYDGGDFLIFDDEMMK
jgi:hypothetical protein